MGTLIVKPYREAFTAREDTQFDGSRDEAAFRPVMHHNWN